MVVSIPIGNERFKKKALFGWEARSTSFPHGAFSPGFSGCGLCGCAFFMSCFFLVQVFSGEVDFRKHLYGNIVLSESITTTYNQLHHDPCAQVLCLDWLRPVLALHLSADGDFQAKLEAGVQRVWIAVWWPWQRRSDWHLCSPLSSFSFFFLSLRFLDARSSPAKLPSAISGQPAKFFWSFRTLWPRSSLFSCALSPSLPLSCAMTLSVYGQQPTPIPQETQSSPHLTTVSSPCTPFHPPEHSYTSLQTYLLRARGGISTEERKRGSVGVDLVRASKAEAVSLVGIDSRGSSN